jgi:hypothetical protein
MTEGERLEFEAREKWREKKVEQRARHLSLIETLIPSLPTPGEPKAEMVGLIEVDARTGRGEVLADVEREHGSRVVVLGKHYDGMMGRAPRHYAHVCVWYRTGGGVQFRTRGCALENPAEARAVAAALLAWADKVESAGGEP